MHYKEITELNTDLVHRSMPDLFKIDEVVVVAGEEK
jgi:hypothetical protein